MSKNTLTEFCNISGETELLSEWDYEKNGNLTPDDVTFASRKRILWQCGEGYIWPAPIGRRCCAHSGCPVCAGTISKKRLERYDRIMRDACFRMNGKIK